MSAEPEEVSMSGYSELQEAVKFRHSQYYRRQKRQEYDISPVAVGGLEEVAPFAVNEGHICVLA